MRASRCVALLLAGGAVLGLGCDPARVHPTADQPVTKSLGGGEGDDGEEREKAVAMPGPNRRRGDAAVSDNDACVACHQDVAADWRGSLHQRANVDQAYREAFAREPDPFCRSCHAPEAVDPREVPSASVGELGVGCVTCHVTEPGSVLAAARPSTEEPERAPHPVVRSASFAATGACAGCHEFTFPGALPGHGPASFMQTTVTEHQRATPLQTCADCHMPHVGGRRSHRFSEVRDPNWLRNQLDVQFERVPEGVRARVAQRSPGHAFPTGDLFRRLAVGCVLFAPGADAPSQREIARDERFLTRVLVADRHGPHRRLVTDSRLFDAARVVTLTVPDDPGEVTCWVSHQRVASVGDGSDPRSADVESELLLFTTTLTDSPSAASP